MQSNEVKINGKVKRIISEYTNIKVKNIEDNTKLAEDLGLTSFDIVSILSEFEGAFSLEIDSQEIFLNVETVSDLSKIIVRLCSENGE